MTWFELLNIIVLSNRPPATFPTFVGGGNRAWKLVSISFLLFVTKTDLSVQISLYCRGCSQPPLKINILYSCFSLHPLICYSFFVEGISTGRILIVIDCVHSLECEPHKGGDHIWSVPAVSLMPIAVFSSCSSMMNTY